MLINAIFTDVFFKYQYAKKLSVQCFKIHMVYDLNLNTPD